MLETPSMSYRETKYIVIASFWEFIFLTIENPLSYIILNLKAMINRCSRLTALNKA